MPIRAWTRCSASSKRWSALRLNAPREEMFDGGRPRDCTRTSGLPVPSRAPRATGALVPYLNEPWYCCAEPSAEQVALI